MNNKVVNKKTFLQALEKVDTNKIKNRYIKSTLIGLVTWCLLFYFAFVQKINWVESFTMWYAYFTCTISYLTLIFFVTFYKMSGVNLIGGLMGNHHKIQWFYTITLLFPTFVFLHQEHYILAIFFAVYAILNYHLTLNVKHKIQKYNTEVPYLNEL